MVTTMIKRTLIILISVMILFSLLTSAAFCADENTVITITKGTSKTHIHQILGEPTHTSSCGFKEIFELSDGKTAILQYVDDILSDGFILIN